MSVINPYSSRKIDNLEEVFHPILIHPRSARWYRGLVIAQFNSEPRYVVYGTNADGRTDQMLFAGARQGDCKKWIDATRDREDGPWIPDLDSRCRATAMSTGARCWRYAKTCDECGEVRCLQHTKCGHRGVNAGGRPRKDPGRPCLGCNEVKGDDAYYWSAGFRFSRCKECLRLEKTPRV